MVGGGPATWARWTDGGFYNGPGPRCQDQACDWRRRHADSRSARPQPRRKPSQSEYGWIDGETPHWLGGTRPPPRCYPGRVFGSWLVPPPRPMLWAAVVHARERLLDPCAYSPLSCFLGCDAVRCGVIGMRAGRWASLVGSWLFSAVEPCLKQSRSCGLVTRMATSIFRGLVARSLCRGGLAGASGRACLATSVSIRRSGSTGP